MADPEAEDVPAETCESVQVEARRQRERWHVELREHDCWFPVSSPTTVRDLVIEALAERRARHAGRDFRMVRSVTTYTVEEA